LSIFEKSKYFSKNKKTEKTKKCSEQEEYKEYLLPAEHV
jgi:hypothetical protein